MRTQQVVLLLLLCLVCQDHCHVHSEVAAHPDGHVASACHWPNITLAEDVRVKRLAVDGALRLAAADGEPPAPPEGFMKTPGPYS